MEGQPNPESMCDQNFRGDAYPFLPKLKGKILTPDSPLMETVSGSLRCKYSLVSGNKQSVVIKVIFGIWYLV